MNDTPDVVNLAYREMLMRKSGAERIAMASGMFDSARAMMLASFPKGSSPGEIRRMLLERTYPEIAFASRSASRLTQAAYRPDQSQAL